MNRILFERSEIADGVATFGGERAEHVVNVLHGEVGQILKTGEIDGKIGTSEILSISREPEAVTITAAVSHEALSPRPWIDLILAPPRPRVMKRLLPQLAAMGVGRIILVGAKKVEKDFWGATLLKAENYRPLLIEGLQQAGTSILPTLECRKSFARFLREELPSFPAADRIVAHPHVSAAQRFDSKRTTARDPSASQSSTPLLAIGPEGGWTDDEVAALAANGFRGYSLGSRILRTDTATIALLAQLMEKYATL